MRIKFKWEKISLGTFRAKVVGGWIIVTVEYSNEGTSMVFIPDANHEWEIEKE